MSRLYDSCFPCALRSPPRQSMAAISRHLTMDHDTLVAQFVSITQADLSTAKGLLEVASALLLEATAVSYWQASAWNLEAAIQLHMDIG